MTELQNTFGIITGVAEGMGNPIARAYARAGMRLALMDVQAEKLHALADEFKAQGVDCLPLVVDLSDTTATRTAIEQALQEYGTPRVLLHNAAVLNERSFSEVSFEQWRKEVDIILQAAFLLSKAVWTPMCAAQGGSIIYISSGSALKGFLKEAAYCPAKHGQEGLMKVLAMEGEPYNIAVNTVTPGAPINTPMSRGHYPEELRQKWIDPAVLAPAFVWLAAQNASEVTGKRLDAYQVAQSLSAARDPLQML